MSNRPSPPGLMKIAPPGPASPARRLRLTVLASIFALAIAGCHGVKLPAWVPGPETPVPRLADQAAEVEAHAAAIEQAALAADDLAALLAGAEGIRSELTTILGHALDLRTDTAPAIVQAGHTVDAIAGERDAASKAAIEQSREVARLNEQLKSGLRSKLLWVGGIALLGIVLAGAGAFFAPIPWIKKLSIGIMIYCVAVFAASATLSEHWDLFVDISGWSLIGIVLAGIGYGIWLQVQKSREVKTFKETIVPELVETVAAVKTELSPEKEKALFAVPTDAGVTSAGAVYQIQSPPTVAAVAEVRADMAAAKAAVQQPGA